MFQETSNRATNSTSQTQDPNTIEVEIQSRVHYKDYDYFLPKQDVRDVRQRLKILSKFNGNPSLKDKYWEKLLITGKDSPGCFIEMIKNRPKGELLFHNTTSSNANEWKWVYQKLQAHDSHRIEMLPENVGLVELVRDLNEIICANQVLFNIGKSNHLLNNVLYSMNNLTWLNMADSGLTTSKIQSILQMINRGKLQRLKALVITGNDRIEMQDLKSELEKVYRGELQYLETDLKADDAGDGSILEPLAVSNEFKLMNDAKKLQYLIRRGVICGDESEVTIDYGVSNHDWNERVKLGLAESYRGLSYRVLLKRSEAKLSERLLSEKISKIMVRGEFGSSRTPIVKRRKPSKGLGVRVQRSQEGSQISRTPCPSTSPRWSHNN